MWALIGCHSVRNSDPSVAILERTFFVGPGQATATKMMLDKKREDETLLDNVEEEPNFSDPEDYIDDIRDEGN